MWHEPTEGFTLSDLAQTLGLPFQGGRNIKITGLAPPLSARRDELSFLEDTKLLHDHIEDFAKRAPVLIAHLDAKKIYRGPLIVSDEPRYHFSLICQKFAPKDTEHGIHPNAIIAGSAEIARNVHIGAYTVIGEKATIGDNTRIGESCLISDGCSIGERCTVMHGVSIASSKIGNGVSIKPGTTIGYEGFGFVQRNGEFARMPHLGGVIIEDDVEIGSNCAVDRGTLGNTRICKSVRMDNMIHIAHNVTVGDNTMLAACSGIMGSTSLGKNCMLGGGSCIFGHLSVADNVVISPRTAIRSNINQSGHFASGSLARPYSEWRRSALSILKFSRIVSEIRRLLHIKIGGKNEHF